MNEANNRKLLELIVNIAPGGGTAEQESDQDQEFLNNFLPIVDYRYALEPTTLLILGGRGVGKTELFRLLAISSGREYLVKSLNITSLPDLNRATWIAGFGRTKKVSKKFPAQEIIEKHMINADNIQWRSFWIGLILGVLLQQEDFKFKDFIVEKMDTELAMALRDKLSLLSDWQSIVYQDLEKINFILDELDQKLLAADEWLFVSYDELDKICTSYTSLANPIRELLALWLERFRRWDRIRPKIFLRTDLFQEDFLRFPDASKLKAYQVKLEWKHPWLYQLLVKRLANSGIEMVEYLQGTPQLISNNQDGLGWTVSSSENLFEELIERMIGKYMGTTPKKGFTYRWIPNHLQDAGGRIAPRSFLKLFVLAAQQRIQQQIYTGTLLQPSNLQGALMDTSEVRILELGEEYPWLESLKISLNGLEAPVQKDKFLEAVESTIWKDDRQPPASNSEEILKYLLQLGVVESRSDGRINMPEIYLYGFKVKRKGGVKRPK
jgi:hypothetical protein